MLVFNEDPFEKKIPSEIVSSNTAKRIGIRVFRRPVRSLAVCDWKYKH